jgi:outer membrane protein assembly factor BamB
VAPLADSDAFDWSQEPKFVWGVELGEGYGLGSVFDGKYFQMDAVLDPATRGIKERIRCFDLATGAPIWEQSQPIVYRDLYGYDDGPRGTPAIADTEIYSLGVSGKLTCRDLASGMEIWTVDTNKVYGVVQNFFGVGASPLVLDDLVIVMVGGSPERDQRVPPGQLDRVSTNGSLLVALDRKTGNEKWRAGNDLASYSSPRPMQLDGKTVVLAFARNGLVAVDPVNGKELWRVDHRAEILESVNGMVPVVDQDRVFISECYEVGSSLLRVNRAGAETIWKDPPRDRRRQSMRVHWSTPILIDGFLYGSSGRNAPDSDFRCIEFATGKVSWSDDRRTRVEATRVGKMLVLLDEQGRIEMVRPNPEKLEVVARWDWSKPSGKRPALTYPCWGAPIVVGDRLIVRGETSVVCFQLARR